MWRTILAVSLYIDGFQLLGAAGPVVHLPIGSVVGRERETATGFKYYSYEGIPFAEPPVGHLRFQAPIEKKPWNNILDATQVRSVCYQTSFSFGIEKEDCLVLNVYTPEGPCSKRRSAVMVFFPGGGFIDGVVSPIINGPDHLLPKEVLVVEVNYRTGFWGFLSTGDTVVPGNAGLKDQKLALQWIQEYITKFGGDPDRVTVFSQSAGAASASYHMLNPGCKDLFRGAILQSGSSLSVWALNRKQVKRSFELAKVIDEDAYSSINSSKALLTYLQGIPPSKIKAATYKILTMYPPYNYDGDVFPVGPVAEVEHENAFFTGRQYEQLKKGNFCHVSVIMGFNSQEEIELLTSPLFRTTVSLTEEYREALIPSGMNVKPELREKVAELIYDHYTPNETFIENPRNLVNFIDDNWFIRPIIKEAELKSGCVSTWLYEFEFKGALAEKVTTPVLGYSPDVGHSEELNYIFSINVTNHNTTDVSKYSLPDRLTLYRITTMWTDFAKHNNPTPNKDELLIEWPRFDKCSQKFLRIGSDLLVQSFPEKESIQFWEDLYKEYGRPPFDTY